MPDTIITERSGNSGAGVVLGIVLVVALVLGGLWLYNNGFFNRGTAAPAVTVQVPAVQVEAPAVKVEAPAK
jgi:ABC-type transporter Mla subunit MlaD